MIKFICVFGESEYNNKHFVNYGSIS